MCKYDLVLAGQSVELVGCGDEFLAGQFRNCLCNFYVKSLRCIQTGTNSSTAQRQCLQVRQRRNEHLAITLEGCAPSADFLRELDRGRILQMGSAALYDALMLFFQTAEGCHQFVNCRQYLILYSQNSRDVHCSGECVIGRLAHVDIIVRMQDLLASDFVATIRNNFIGIHVGLRAASCLPYDQREVFIQTAGDHLVTGSGNCRKLFLCHALRTELVVRHCSSLFQDTESVCDLTGHGLDAYTDQKVLVAALCLSCPILVGRYLYLAHRIVFNAILHVHLSYFENSDYAVHTAQHRLWF